MKNFVLAAVCALGLSLTASAGASAAPLAGAAFDGINMSPIQQAQVVIVAPGHRRFHRARVCRRVTRCFTRHHGRRVCRVETVCRRY
jgi:hypothetical protein